jgi:hypothetical protein
VRQRRLVNHIDMSVDPLDGAHGYLAPGFGLRATYALRSGSRTAERMILRDEKINVP